jgi:molybdopterin/thiamine biosynthesis adenylyltransferase
MTVKEFRSLQAHLLADENEHAAILVCGTSSNRDMLLCRRVVPLQGDDLRSSGHLHLQVSPIALARLAKQAAYERGTLVVCHSHPFPGVVAASSIDLETEAELCGRALPGRLDRRPVGALILGPDGFDGRLWHNGAATLLTLTVGGFRLRLAESPFHTEEHEARQLLLWGTEGQRRLRDASIAVVGAGGTGSHVVTQLAHIGVGHLVIVDDDVVEPSNLSRLVGATLADVGAMKARVLAATVSRTRPETTVEPIVASLLELDASQLARCDAIVCCTDGHGSRSLLTELTAQYLVPLVDLGIEVQPGRHGSRAGGGVRVVRPGEPCLHCMGILDPALVREEFLAEHERQAELARGYLRGLREPAPSVIALNGVVASLAVVEVIDILAGVFDQNPVRLLYRAEARTVTTAGVRRDPACWVCGTRGLIGLGDARQLPRRLGNRARGRREA